MDYRKTRINLISTNEGEFQPLGIASPAAYLRQKEFEVHTTDALKSPIETKGFDILAFSVPIFGAIDSTIEAAVTARQEGFSGPLVFYNQYATVQPESFIVDRNCHVILGEFEEVLCELAEQFSKNRKINDVKHTWNGQGALPEKCLKRSSFITPDRSTLPPLSTYAKTPEGKVIGNIETMRGCAHDCTYCSVYAAYSQRVIKLQEESILQDIKNCIEMGAEHITLIDADFFSTGKRGLRILEAMKGFAPDIPFDLTCRLDDVIRYEPAVKRLKELGCVEITTAVEFPSDKVLSAVVKRITLEQTYRAIKIIKDIGIKLKPTFITYSPWMTSDDLDVFEKFIKETDIAHEVDELQRQTRLLLYKGAPILNTGVLGNIKVVEHNTYYEWEHEDKKVDEAYLSSLTPGSEGIKRCCIKG